jgi:hypothetical protein
VGQDRAKNWRDQNVVGKAVSHNQRIEEVKGLKANNGTSSAEKLEIERLNKVVQKQQRMVDFAKHKKEEENYNNA